MSTKVVVARLPTTAVDGFTRYILMRLIYTQPSGRRTPTPPNFLLSQFCAPKKSKQRCTCAWERQPGVTMPRLRAVSKILLPKFCPTTHVLPLPATSHSVVGWVRSACVAVGPVWPGLFRSVKILAKFCSILLATCFNGCCGARTCCPCQRGLAVLDQPVWLWGLFGRACVAA